MDDKYKRHRESREREMVCERTRSFCREMRRVCENISEEDISRMIKTGIAKEGLH